MSIFPRIPTFPALSNFYSRIRHQRCVAVFGIRDASGELATGIGTVANLQVVTPAQASFRNEAFRRTTIHFYKIDVTFISRKPGRKPGRTLHNGGRLQASTRPCPHPARADTAHTPMHATRDCPTRARARRRSRRPPGTAQSGGWWASGCALLLRGRNVGETASLSHALSSALPDMAHTTEIRFSSCRNGSPDSVAAAARRAAA